MTEELLLNDLSENDEKNLRNFTGAVLYNRKIGFPTIEQDQFYGAIKTDEPRTLDFSGVRGFLVTNVCIVQRSAA